MTLSEMTGKFTCNLKFKKYKAIHTLVVNPNGGTCRLWDGEVTIPSATNVTSGTYTFPTTFVTRDVWGWR